MSTYTRNQVTLQPHSPPQRAREGGGLVRGSSHSSPLYNVLRLPTLTTHVTGEAAVSAHMIVRLLHLVITTHSASVRGLMMTQHRPRLEPSLPSPRGRQRLVLVIFSLPLYFLFAASTQPGQWQRRAILRPLLSTHVQSRLVGPRVLVSLAPLRIVSFSRAHTAYCELYLTRTRPFLIGAHHEQWRAVEKIAPRAEEERKRAFTFATGF